MNILDKYLFGLPDADVLYWVQLAFLWVGFSTVVGTSAKGILLGRVKTTTIVTVILGFLGTIIGWSVADFAMKGLLSEKYDGLDAVQKLLTPATFLFAFLGALVLLFFFKLLTGPLGMGGHEGEKKK